MRVLDQTQGSIWDIINTFGDNITKGEPLTTMEHTITTESALKIAGLIVGAIVVNKILKDL
jgi:hypothetical protein